MNMNEPMLGLVEDSVVFTALNRIDAKINSLKNMLRPIIADFPIKGGAGSAGEPNGDTELLKRLRNVESSITDLLESIKL